MGRAGWVWLGVLGCVGWVRWVELGRLSLVGLGWVGWVGLSVFGDQFKRTNHIKPSCILSAVPGAGCWVPGAEQE